MSTPNAPGSGETALPARCHPRGRRGHQRIPLEPAPLIYRIIAGIVRPLSYLFSKQLWMGGEHIPARGGVVIAGNHLSYFDPIAFGHFIHDHGRHVRFLGKEEVFRVPIFGTLVRAAGQIPVRRESADAARAFAEAREALASGQCIAVYPEATVTMDPDLWPMSGKTGAVRMAHDAGVPLIPVAQWGPQEVISPDARRVHLWPRRTMRILAGPPVDLSPLDDAPDDPVILARITEELMRRIADQLAVLRGEPAPEHLMDRAELRARQRQEAEQLAQKAQRQRPRRWEQRG